MSCRPSPSWDIPKSWVSVKTSIFDENVVRANRSYDDEHGQEAEAPRKDTVEIDNSRSDGLLEMRAASQSPKV
jgi:hypothetical protein